MPSSQNPLLPVSTQIKKKDNKNHQQRILHYDNDHKFNYRKGYLREDKVPAFISTAYAKDLEHY